MNPTGLLMNAAPTAHVTLAHHSEYGEWEMVVAAPPTPLQPYVREYVGWVERATTSIRRRELPTDQVPVIINLGSRIGIVDPTRPDGVQSFGSFTTGAYDTFVLVETSGHSEALQVNLSLLGARVLLGRGFGDLRNQVVALDDLFGAAALRLEDELHEATTWDARFALVDRALLARLAAASEVSPEVRHAWGRLSASHGRIPIHALVEEIGCSPRRLISRFHDELGLTPKTFGRILRFSQVVRLVKRGQPMRLTDVALACGYYDQAHLNRECRVFAGLTPGELVDSLLPDRGGFVVDVDR